jgi:uncharacterized membrane protein YbhN (UPF0104 family)
MAVLFAAVGIALVRGWGELAAQSWQMDQRAVLGALGLWTLSTVGAAGCWIMVTRAFGLRLPVLRALRVFCTSNLGKYLPGKVLHVFARVYLVQQQGVSVTLGTTSAIMDVLLYIAAGMLVALFALPLAAGATGEAASPPLLLGALLAVLVGFALLHPRPLNALLSLGGRFSSRLRGLRIELSYPTILSAFLVYVVLWLLVTAAVYASVRAVVDVSPDRAPILGAIFALSYVVGLFTPSPGGLGGREAVMIVLFGFFMPHPAAVVASILNRILQVASEAICAGLLSFAVRE